MPSFFSNPFVTHRADSNTIVSAPQVGTWLVPDGNMVQRQVGPEATSLFGMDLDETLCILISIWIDYTEPTQQLVEDQVLWDVSCLDVDDAGGTIINSNIAAGGFACTFASGGTDLFRVHYREGGSTTFTEISANAGDLDKAWYPGNPNEFPFGERLTTETQIGAVIVKAPGERYIGLYIDGSLRQSDLIPDSDKTLFNWPTPHGPAGLTLWGTSRDFIEAEPVTEKLFGKEVANPKSSSFFVLRTKYDISDKFSRIMAELSEQRLTFPPTARGL